MNVLWTASSGSTDWLMGKADRSSLYFRDAASEVTSAIPLHSLPHEPTKPPQRLRAQPPLPSSLSSTGEIVICLRKMSSMGVWITYVS